MLRVTSVRDVTGRYLLDDPAREVSDLFGGAQPGRWFGSAAARQGLSGSIDVDDLRVMLSGRVPNGTLEPTTRQRVAARDLIFAAPKPVSLLFATGDHEVARTTVVSHEVAVAAALGYVEDRAAGVVRMLGRGERAWLHAEGITAAAFTHGASRSGDPHLHSHVLLANRARAEDGRFGAIDAMALHAHASAADAIYRSVLRVNLTRDLGVRFQRAGDGSSRIAGITDADCVALSGRSEEVRRGDLHRPEKITQSRAEALDRWMERLRHTPAFDEQPRFERSALHLDEHHAASVLYGRPLTARLLIESVASAATAGITVDALGEIVRRIEVPLGRGVAEMQLPSSVLPSQRALLMLGPRPTDRRAMAAWLDDLPRVVAREQPEPRLIARGSWQWERRDDVGVRSTAHHDGPR